MGRRLVGRHHIDYCWIEVDGRVLHVSHYVGRARPSNARCPVCGAQAILHLGAKNSHHYQHQGGASGCPLSEGETAKHFNAKHHVAEQLRAGAPLHIRGRCPGDGIETVCSHTHELLWVQDWIDIGVESTVGALRPDVLILGETGPLAAVEILVTHSVTQEKASVLTRLNVPWVEVTADDALSWSLGEALPILRCDLAPDMWLCDDHRAARDRRLKEEEQREKARLAAAARAAREQQEEDARRARQRTVTVMVIDAVTGAKRSRYVFRVTVQMQPNGKAAERVWLSCDQAPSYYFVDGEPDRSRTLHLFSSAAIAYMTDLMDCDHYEFLESPNSGWQPPDAVDPAALVDVAQYPPRYRWDGERETWTPIYMPEA
jgi:hypothetical protein